MNKTIEVKIHYHKNSNGEMEPDWEEMTEELEEALQEIDEKIEMFWQFEYDGEGLEEDVERARQMKEMQDMKMKQMIANKVENGTITLA